MESLFCEPGGLVPVLTEPPSCGSFLCTKVEDGRWKMEEGRWKREEGRGKMEEGRRKREEGRRKI